MNRIVSIILNNRVLFVFAAYSAIVLFLQEEKPFENAANSNKPAVNVFIIFIDAFAA